MYTRLTRLALIVIFVAVVSYLFYFNPQETVINLGPSTAVSWPLALCLIVSFFLGVTSLALVATWIGLKMQFERWRLNKKMSAQNSHYRDLAMARDLLALKDADGARGLLLRIISKDKDDILARLALADSYNLSGKFKEAIHVLEEARAEQRLSPALLLILSTAYEALGNKTAALDNVLLALKASPKSTELLKRTVSLSKALNRVEEAMEYSLELLKVCPYEQQDEIQQVLAELRLEALCNKIEESSTEVQQLKNPQNNNELLKQELQTLLRIHKDYEPALLLLAETYFKSDEPEKAIKTLKRAVQKQHSKEALAKMVSFWKASDNPTASIKLLKETIESTPTLEIPSRILLVQLLLQLEHLEECQAELEILEKLLALDENAQMFLKSLRAKLESRLPGRSTYNSSLESLISAEAAKAGFPRLSSSIAPQSLTFNESVGNL